LLPPSVMVKAYNPRAVCRMHAQRHLENISSRRPVSIVLVSGLEKENPHHSRSSDACGISNGKAISGRRHSKLIIDLHSEGTALEVVALILDVDLKRAGIGRSKVS
jgi:hypothetical protein